jgi:hypothetical protein
MIQLQPHEKWVELKPRGVQLRKRYALSSHGRLISFTNELTDGQQIGKANRWNYTDAQGTVKRLNVAQLVAKHFLPPPPSNKHKFVLHKDGSGANNHMDNLAWATYEEMRAHISRTSSSKPYGKLVILQGEVFKPVQIEYQIPTRLQYAISNYGRLISFLTDVKDGTLLTGSKHQLGYRIWRFRDVDGVSRGYLLHRLVADAFLKKPSTDANFVIHLDHNKENNKATNLRWVTQEALTAHAATSAAVQKNREKIRTGATQTQASKLTVTKAMLLKRILNDPKRTTRYKSLATRFGVSEMQLHRIKTGENWGWLNAGS